MSSEKILDRTSKLMIFALLFLVAWSFVIHLASIYIRDSSEKNWEVISRETNQKNKDYSNELFQKYKKSLLEFSRSLESSESFRRNLSKNDSKKLFEELLSTKTDESYQTEVYNSKLELIAFKGRKLEPDVYSLQRTLKGSSFTLIRELGFFTYLIQYSPVYSSGDSLKADGVLLNAVVLDVKDPINNRFFNNAGFINELSKKTGAKPELFAADPISGKVNYDSIAYAGKEKVDLTGTDNAIIGYLFPKEYDEILHVQSIENLGRKIISGLVFGATVLFFLICLRLSERLPSRLPKLALFIGVLIVIRYVWLEFSFPAIITGFEIFYPGDYASTFGNGIARSLGDLFITSFFVLLCALYGFYITVKGSGYISLIARREHKIVTVVKIILAIASYFTIIYLFGITVQSIVYDSNLQFFDKTNVIPSVSLFTLNLSLLIFAFSMFLFLISLVIIANRKILVNLLPDYNIRKYGFIFIMAIIVLLNFLAAPAFDDFNIEEIYRILIIALSFMFGIYLSYKLYLNKNYNVFSLKNFSIVVIFCMVTVPGILLEKITSQETHFVELIGERIAEKEEDRVRFMLITELSKLADSKRLESEIDDKSKQQELAFSVWSESKLSEESFNTIVILTDTNRVMKSDFVFGTGVLQPDSVLAFSERTVFREIKEPATEEDSVAVADTLETEEEVEEVEFGSIEGTAIFSTENITIVKNELGKYLLGIVPLEIVSLRETEYKTLLGYLMIAIEYDSRNLLLQSSTQIFRNHSTDRLFDKLISTPVITEYIGGDIASSTNRDLSKENTTSLNLFRESVKNKPEKSGWRYENINNEKYRSFYIKAGEEELTLDERIFAISLKRSDVRLIIFFYLKFILFTVLVYIAVVAVVFIVMIARIKSLEFNFREKLFTSFFIVSVIPIILLAVYTRTFIKNKYDVNLQNELISDLNLVSQSIRSSQALSGNADSLRFESGRIISKSIQPSDKNFNIFAKHALVATTDEELYKSDLLDTRADADAYYSVYVTKKDFFSKAKELGQFSFIVGYRPLFDQKNNLIGLISSQTVYKQNLMNEELTEILTFIFGTYFIVIIVLLIFVTFMTDRISKPILSLQKATEKIAKGESNVALDVRRKDEIGKLVESFNKMSEELENSKQQLKRAEREAAWRDIARRVAHEIKNPLTPMKLSIQHLYDLYVSGNKNNFAEPLKKTRDIIIKEVDNLNRIATEFSDFAKLPGKNYEDTDLNAVLEEVISLYSHAREIRFVKHLDPEIGLIRADKQELNRVFQNLIKNSIQAIEDNGLVEVKTYRNNGRIVAEVCDNGSGIDPEIAGHLFTPNFSTKSTGMGLGLAIAKKSLDDMKAEITFESFPDRGTKAVIRFIPLKEQKS